MITHLSLFSGIGGLDLAAEWAGITTVGQCEWADYPTKVLEKHWPDVPRWRDIRTLTGDDFYERTGLHTVDIISGGFPCQPFSVAGKRRGKEDDRFLWPEMVRVIAQLRPTWVVGENVTGIVNMALDDVLFDLEAQGYKTRTFLIPAHAVGAPHRRYRTAIVAHTKGEYERGLSSREKPEIARSCIRSQNVCNATGKRFQDGTGKPLGGSGTQKPEPERSGGYVSDAEKREHVRRTTCTEEFESVGKRKENHTRGIPKYVGGEWWATEPAVGRVANGVPNRVDRLKCLGNAVVPQQFYPVFQAIADIERGEEIIMATACVERLAAYEDTGFTSEQIHNQKHNLGIAYNIISGYEQCIREIFKRQQEHNGRQYIDAEEAAGIIDKIMSGRLKEVKR